MKRRASPSARAASSASGRGFARAGRYRRSAANANVRCRFRFRFDVASGRSLARRVVGGGWGPSEEADASSRGTRRTHARSWTNAETSFGVPGRVAREEVGEVAGDAPVRRAPVVQDRVVEAAGGDGATRLGRDGRGRVATTRTTGRVPEGAHARAHHRALLDEVTHVRLVVVRRGREGGRRERVVIVVARGVPTPRKRTGNRRAAMGQPRASSHRRARGDGHVRVSARRRRNARARGGRGGARAGRDGARRCSPWDRP